MPETPEGNGHSDNDVEMTMESFEYRVVTFDATEEGDVGFFIIEAYYDESGAVVAYKEPSDSHPGGESVDELRADLNLMLAALDRPVLTEADLPGVERFTDD